MGVDRLFPPQHPFRRSETCAVRFDGQTILITGASSGIGLGYAQEFAMRGANLVLVARSSDRLGNLASQLHAQYGITVEPISTDLSVPGAPTVLLERIGQAGHLLDGVVNNAGFGDHGDVGSADPHRLSSMVTLNCTALVELTRATRPSCFHSPKHSGTKFVARGFACLQSAPGAPTPPFSPPQMPPVRA
ncbi:MAG: SDR family NAD(P)-dependent oxidoreductase [Proteobacteria bacterium]|nr:SDR family NAD(P)-dependent oxidoreductase [Pseudomonadota bacterium]